VFTEITFAGKQMRRHKSDVAIALRATRSRMKILYETFSRHGGSMFDDTCIIIALQYRRVRHVVDAAKLRGLKQRATAGRRSGDEKSIQQFFRP